MSKLYNNSGVLGCKSPQKLGNSPQKGGKMVLPAQECENLENSTCSTQLATPFTASEQGAAVEKLDNGVLAQSVAGVKLDTAAHEQGVAERRYVAGAEKGSVLNGRSNMDELKKADLSKFETQKSALGTAKKHSKVLRAVACGCLAILMCGTAFLGTACSGSAAAVGAGGVAPAGINYGNGTTGNAGQGSAAGAEQNFATQSGGLITPRADDPVLFETKDGLQIKQTQANPQWNGVHNTKQCYYFTLGTYNGQAINWGILGIGTQNPPTDPAGAGIGSEIAKQTFATMNKIDNVPYGQFVAVANFVYGTTTAYAYLAAPNASSHCSLQTWTVTYTEYNYSTFNLTNSTFVSVDTNLANNFASSWIGTGQVTLTCNTEFITYEAYYAVRNYWDLSLNTSVTDKRYFYGSGWSISHTFVYESGKLIVISVDI